MQLSDLLWLFVVFSLITPLVRQRMLESSRFRAIHRFEMRRRSRVITMIHRQESMNLLGFPLMRYIDINDSEEIVRAVKMTDKDIPIDLILHTPGGLVLAAEQIAHALKNHPAKVTVFIPHYAMSGGTLIALSADEIVMDENAVLGPVDPQLGEYPAASVLKVLELKDANEIDDRTMILADVARKALAQVKDCVLSILDDKIGEPERAEQIATALTQGKWTHDYPITVAQARELGLPISTEIPVDVERLMSLFPQAGNKRPSVQYVPIPYRQDQSKKLR